jgi:acyl dehydratase
VGVSLFYEDFEPGRVLDAGARTITESDIAQFAELSGDRNPLHTDEVYARATAFGSRVAHGALGIAVVTGLVSRAGFTRESLVALSGLTWRFRAPVRPGDRVAATLRVAERHDGGRSDRGTVVFAVSVRNQHGELVQEGELREVVRKRGS